MPALDASNLTALRLQPVSRDWKLYIYQPVTLWTGTVGGAPSEGDRSLTVATVTGDPADLTAGMTIRVTTAADALKTPPPSKVRFKSYGAPTMVVAENAVDWAVGDKLAGVRLWEIWPRIPFINPDTYVQFKDRDVAWSSDADVQLPKANAGPAVIATLSGGVADTVFKDEGSFICPEGNAVTSYQWAAIPAVGSGDPGAPTVQAGAENTSTVTYRWDTAGYYYVSLTVTDGNGKTGVRYIPVIIDDGTLPTQGVPGSRGWEGHGWALTRNLIGIDAADSTWLDGSPAFLVADTYGVPTAAFVDNRANLRLSGWLIEDSVQRDVLSREVSFRAVSTAHVLARTPAWPVRMETQAAPADWYGIKSGSVDSIAYLLLLWHSTAMWVSDYQFAVEDEWVGGAGARARPGENCDADDLLTQVNRVLDASKSDLRCDRQGILRAIRHEWFLTAAELAARVTVMTLANTDFQQISYGPHPHRARVREVRADGVAGDSTPYLAGAPGASPLDGGRPREISKLSPKDQAELNQWAGQQLAYENWNGIARLKMAGEFDAFDPARGEFIAGTLSSFDSRIPDGPYSVVSVRQTDDHLLGLTVGELELLPAPGAYPGTARPLPIDPPMPPLPIELPLPEDLPPVEPGGSGEVWVFGTDQAGVVSTLNMRSGNPPDWSQLNGGLGDASFIRWFTGDKKRPSSHLACIDDTGEVYVHESWRDGGNWSLALSEVAAAAVLEATGTGTVTNVNILQVYGFSTTAAEKSDLYVLCNGDADGIPSNSFARVLVSTDWGSTWSVLGGATNLWGRISVFVGAPTCKYTARQVFTIFDRRIIAASGGGMLAYTGAGGLIFAARASGGALSRSNYFTYSSADGWELPGRIPDSHSVECGDLLSLTVGGTDNPPTAGPGGIVVSQSGGIFLGNWYMHEDSGFAGDAYLVQGPGIPYDATTPSDTIGAGPGMLLETPHPSDDFIALEVSGTTTRIYRNSVSVIRQTINRTCFFGICYNSLLDGRVLMCVGRTSGGGEASSAEPELIWFSEDGGGSFIEVGQSMFADFGCLGITGGFSDDSSD